MSRSGEPIAIAAGGRRWTARATSVPAIEAELSRIWAAAARDSHRAHLSARARALALGDPHLAGRLDVAGDVGVRMRTSVLTLLVMAERPETAERALDAINLLATRHPSRALVLCPGDPDGPASIDAGINAACRVAERSGAETCTEEIVLRVGGEIGQHLDGLVQPLLIHDLPVVLWWLGDPPLGRQRFADLLATCDRLLLDSGSFVGGGPHLAALARLCAAGRPVVHDVGWMRLTFWRELLAGLFEHPLLTPELAAARTLRIDVLLPGDPPRLTKAALFAGWLAATLQWRIERPLTASRGDPALLRGTARGAGGEVRIEVRAVHEAGAPGLLSPGSLVRVELELGRRGHDVQARVTRQADHLSATAYRSGAEVSRRAGRLAPFGEAPYLAEALQRAAPDRLLDRSIERAVQLLGG